LEQRTDALREVRELHEVQLRVWSANIKRIEAAEAQLQAATAERDALRLELLEDNT
jgi:hypothetical protein